MSRGTSAERAWFKKREPYSVLVSQTEDNAYVAESGTTGEVLYGPDGDASVVIGAAFASLTSGRTSKEKVVLKGSINIKSTITIPSYTHIVLDGILKVNLGNDVPAFQITDSNDIVFEGGVIDGVNKYPRGFEPNGTGLKDKISIRDVYFINLRHGIAIKAVGGGINRLSISNCLFENLNYSAFRCVPSDTGEVNAIIKNCVITNCGNSSYSDAGICLEKTGLTGVFIIDSVKVFNQDGTGFYLQVPDAKVIADNIYAYNCGEYGGVLVDAEEAIMSNVEIESCRGNGFYVYSSTIATGESKLTLMNIMVRNSDFGICINKASSRKMYLTLTNFIAEKTTIQPGLRILTAADLGDVYEPIIISNGILYDNFKSRTANIELGELSVTPSSGTTLRDVRLSNIETIPTSSYTYSLYLASSVYGSIEKCKINKGTSRGVVISWDNWVMYMDEGDYKTIGKGTATFSGNGTTTTFTIAHGLAGTPRYWNVLKASNITQDIEYVTADATNLTVVFEAAPPSGTNNVVLSWRAEM